MRKTDILIIGGGPAGIVAAVTTRKNHLTKKITLVREGKKSVIPCGIPYVFNRLNSVEKNLMPDKPLKMNKIDLLIDKVTKIYPTNKKVSFESGKELTYEKLILATGSKSNSIPIDGVNKEGVWYIKKNFEYLKKFRKTVLKSKNIVIVGGGFIGVEFAEEFSNIKRLNISIIEKSEHCLATSFDEEFNIATEKKLKEKNVNIYTNTIIEKITGKNKVEFVQTKNKKIPADIVILSIGAKPNINLLKESKIKIGKNGGIKVNEYMETNFKDIFAVGDCAETRCLLTKKYVPIMLASTACHEARIAAANLYKRKNLLKNNGTLAVFSTYVNGLAMGIAGLTEKKARDEGFDIIIGENETLSHHPGVLPNTQKIKVKLIFSRTSGKLLGGQITGPETIGEMVNILALAIQKETTVYNFDILQIATHPLLTASPTNYPLITAAQSALIKMKK